MTDNEIIKALECCNGWDGRCLNCPLNREGTNCKEKLNSYAFDLINRQKAKIESLEKELMKCKLEKELLYNVSVEKQNIAIKEFAERLKEKICCEDDCGHHCFDCCYECKDYVPVVDKLVKEMTEVSENENYSM